MDSSSDSIDILFLGTGAADWPVQCHPIGDETPNGIVRGYSSVIINEQILIDCGATVPDAIRHFGSEPNRLTDILLTHTHTDHFDVDAVKCLIASRSRRMAVNLWAHPAALNAVPEIEGVNRCPVTVAQTFELPGILVTGLEANHSVENSTEKALHFLFQNSKKTVLYATDGAWFLKKTWLQLRETVLDAIIWDATCGETQGDWRIFEHNSIDMIRIMVQTLRKEGILSPCAGVFLTHMARTLCAPHEEMAKRLISEGLTPAYDGLKISIGSHLEPGAPAAM